MLRVGPIGTKISDALRNTSSVFDQTEVLWKYGNSAKDSLMVSFGKTSEKNSKLNDIYQISTDPPRVRGDLNYRISSQEMEEKMYISLIYTKYNKLVELVEMESMDVGCAVAILPRNSPRLMAEHDRLFAMAGEPLSTSFFAQDIENWCKSVDQWLVTQLVEKIWLAENEAFESMVMSLMKTHMRGFAWRFIAWVLQLSPFRPMIVTHRCLLPS